jgi:hypothetical protein
MNRKNGFGVAGDRRGTARNGLNAENRLGLIDHRHHRLEGGGRGKKNEKEKFEENEREEEQRVGSVHAVCAVLCCVMYVNLLLSILFVSEWFVGASPQFHLRK